MLLLDAPRQRSAPSRITATLHYVCDLDRRYPNALEAVQTIRALRHRPGRVWVAKHCPVCGGWHLFAEPRSFQDG